MWKYKDMTKEEALAYHRMMWGDMAEEYGDNPTATEREDFKANWVREHFNKPFIHNCVLCEFVKKNPTVYLSTHTPHGYQNLESKQIMRLSDDDMVSDIELSSELVQERANTNEKKWVCSICGYEHYGDEPPENCPRCGQSGDVFKLQD